MSEESKVPEQYPYAPQELNEEMTRDAINAIEYLDMLSNEISSKPSWELMYEAGIDQLVKEERYKGLVENGQDSFRRHRLQAHKSGIRLINESNQIRTSEQAVSFHEIEKMPWQFGLKSNDVINLDNWSKNRFGLEAAHETKYDVLRVDMFRKLIVKSRERKPYAGTILGLDVAKLKIFNSYDHESGDEALKKVADMLHAFLEKMGLGKESQYYIGRQGDEFYCWLPLYMPQDVATSFNQFYRESIESGDLTVQVNSGEKIISNCYWKVTGLEGKDDFDQKMASLDLEVELEKVRVMKKYIDKVIQTTDDAGEGESIDKNLRIALLAQSMLDMRVPTDLIESFMSASIDYFKLYSDEARENFERIIASSGFIIQETSRRFLIDSFNQHLDNGQEVDGKIV